MNIFAYKLLTLYFFQNLHSVAETSEKGFTRNQRTSNFI